MRKSRVYGYSIQTNCGSTTICSRLTSLTKSFYPSSSCDEDKSGCLNDFLTQVMLSTSNVNADLYGLLSTPTVARKSSNSTLAMTSMGKGKQKKQLQWSESSKINQSSAAEPNLKIIEINNRPATNPKERPDLSDSTIPFSKFILQH